MRRFLLLDGLFQSGRSFFSAVSAAYLVSRGLPLSSIGTLKIVQSLGGMILELPTGLAADRLGRRFALLASLGAGALSFLTYFVSRHWAGFALAELLLAMSLSFWSGAFDAFALESMKASPSDNARFYHLKAAIVPALTLFSAFAGGLLAAYHPGLPYLAAMIIFLILLVWVASQLRESPRPSRDEKRPVSSRHLALDSLRGCLVPEVLPTFVGFFLMEIILQPLIYFWQPWFQASSQNFATVRLGAIYLLFQLALMGAGVLFAALSKQAWIRSGSFWIASWTGYSLSMCMMLLNPGFISSLAIFVLAEAFFSVGESSMKIRVNEFVSDSTRASTLSWIGLAVRSGSLISLLVCSGILRALGESTESLRFLFAGSGVAGCLACLVVLGLDRLLVGFLQTFERLDHCRFLSKAK